MSVQDYDRAIDLIEENITLKKRDIKRMVTNMLIMSDRLATEFFKNVDEEGRALTEYISERKLCRALQDFVSGMTNDQIAEKYNYTDMTHFGQKVQAKFEGKTPTMMREAGDYTCPAPRYVADFLEETSKKNNPTTKEMIDYKNELLRMIDENFKLREELSAEKRAIMESKKPVVEGDNKISVEKYNEFLKIEDLRVVYALSVKEIIKLYNISQKTGEELEELCEGQMERNLYSLNDNNSDYDIERLSYRLTYEMDSQEAWDYYFGDDETEPREYLEYGDMLESEDIAEIEHEKYDEYDEDDIPF